MPVGQCAVSCRLFTRHAPADSVDPQGRSGQRGERRDALPGQRLRRAAARPARRHFARIGSDRCRQLRHPCAVPRQHAVDGPHPVRLPGVPGRGWHPHAVAGEELDDQRRRPDLHLPPARRRHLQRRRALRRGSGAGQPRTHARPEDQVAAGGCLHRAVLERPGGRCVHLRSHLARTLCAVSRCAVASLAGDDFATADHRGARDHRQSADRHRAVRIDRLGA